MGIHSLQFITSIRLLISLAAMTHWAIHQLDIKNAFLHGELTEKVYREQPPWFVTQGKFGLVCYENLFRNNLHVHGLDDLVRLSKNLACIIVQLTI